jgi:hypothetical protein
LYQEKSGSPVFEPAKNEAQRLERNRFEDRSDFFPKNQCDKIGRLWAILGDFGQYFILAIFLKSRNSGSPGTDVMIF